MKKQDKLPIYEILINEDDSDITGIDLISLVDKPAIEVKGYAFSDQKCGCGKKEEFVNPSKGETEREFVSRCIPVLMDEGKPQDQAIAICYSLYDDKMSNVDMADEDVPVVGGVKTHFRCKCKIVNGRWETFPEESESGVCEFCLAAQKKWNRENAGRPGAGRFSAVREEQILLGPALIPDIKIFRIDEQTGEEYEVFFSSETIKKIRNKFSKNAGNHSININHGKEMAPAYIIESWLIEDSKTDKAVKYGYDLPVGTWMIAVRVHDEKFWEFMKEEDLTGFSVEGFLDQRLVQMQKLSLEQLIDSLTEDDLLELI
jgi:hypothetical protein